MGWLARAGGALALSAVATVGGYMFGYDEDVALDVAVNGYNELQSSLDAVYRVSSAGITSDDKHIPLAAEAEERLSKSILALESSLTEQMQACTPDNPECLPWSVAQVAIAIAPRYDRTPDLVAAFMAANADEACQCWRHFGNLHVAASSWAILSLTTTGQAVTKPQLESLLKLQSVTGWWPMFPAEYHFEYASTYATAMAALALDAQLKSGTLSGDLKQKAMDARTKAVEWLRLVRQDRGLWADYPHSDYYSITSQALSGLVLYTLHQAYDNDGSSPDWLINADRDWLEQLSGESAEVTDENASLARILSQDGEIIEDTTRHYKVPGTMLGIATAYGAGTPRQRVRALRWLETTLTDQDLASKQVIKQYWLAAETLMALRRVESHLKQNVTVSGAASDAS